MLIFLSWTTWALKRLLFVPVTLDGIQITPGKKLMAKAFWFPLGFDAVMLSLMVFSAVWLARAESFYGWPVVGGLVFLSYTYAAVTAHNNTFRRGQWHPAKRLVLTFIPYTFPYWVFPIAVVLYEGMCQWTSAGICLDGLPIQLVAVLSWYAFIATLSSYAYVVRMFSIYFRIADNVAQIDDRLVEAYQNKTTHFMGADYRDLLRGCNRFSRKNVLLHWACYALFVINLAVCLSCLTFWAHVPFDRSFAFLSASALIFVNVIETLLGFSFEPNQIFELQWVPDIWLIRTGLAILFVAYPTACLIELSFIARKMKKLKYRYWEDSDTNS